METSTTNQMSAEAPIEAPAEEDSLVSFEDKGNLDWTLLLLWIAAAVAILATLLFWFMSNSKAQLLTENQGKLGDIQTQLNSDASVAADKEAKQLAAALDVLGIAHTARFRMQDFLPAIFTKIDKDVKLTDISLSVGTDGLGKISLTGTTGSYAAAAKQLVTLREWQIDSKDVLSEIDLASVTQSVSAAGAVEVPISISANLNFAIDATKAAAAADTTGSTAGEGTDAIE